MMIRVEQNLLEHSICTLDQVMGNRQYQVGRQKKASTNQTFVLAIFHVENSYVPAQLLFGFCWQLHSLQLLEDVIKKLTLVGALRDAL